MFARITRGLVHETDPQRLLRLIVDSAEADLVERSRFALQRRQGKSCEARTPGR